MGLSWLRLSTLRWCDPSSGGVGVSTFEFGLASVFADVRSPLLSASLLRCLFLADSNQISDAGASALAAALQGSQLERLVLSEYLNESL